jgi:hypothetical protein
MLSKCANPSCSTSFRYLHEGKLFRFEIEWETQFGEKPEKGGRRVEYFWLCTACSAFMSLRYDRTTGVRAVPILFWRAAS